MVKDGGSAVRCRLRAGLLGMLLLAACGGPAANPAWTLAGEPGLLFTIKQYYERNALEEGGRCTAPLLEGVTGTEVLENDAERMVVALRYYYRDAIRDDDDCDRLRPLRCTVMRECRGFAERTFTIAKEAADEEARLSVIEMTGPQRGHRWTPGQ